MWCSQHAVCSHPYKMPTVSPSTNLQVLTLRRLRPDFVTVTQIECDLISVDAAFAQPTLTANPHPEANPKSSPALEPTTESSSPHLDANTESSPHPEPNSESSPELEPTTSPHHVAGPIPAPKPVASPTSEAPMIMMMEQQTRLLAEAQEDMERQRAYDAMWHSALRILERLCQRDWDRLEVWVSECPLTQERSFNRLLSDHANDRDDFFRMTFEDTPPYRYVDVHFHYRKYIRLRVSPAASKRAARDQTSCLSPFAMLSSLYEAWKTKFWPCFQHEPGGRQADTCPYCLQYRGQLLESSHRLRLFSYCIALCWLGPKHCLPGLV